MPSAIDLAAGIMNEDLFRLNVISQNLANTGTHGYKKQMVTAQSFAPQLDAGLSAARISPPALNTVLDTRQGPLVATGNALDVALEGPGFFELSGGDGPVYTRQGSFRLDSTGRLVNSAGLAVVGLGGDIVLNGPQPTIDRQGQIFEAERLAGQLRVVRFSDPAALSPLGGGLYRADAAGETVEDQLQVRQGFLESSNVVALSEMTRLVELVRRFEAAQRVAQGYDGMLGGAIRTLGEF